MGTLSNTYVAVIDDESSICVSMSRLLRLSNFQPICYPSAEAFLEDEKRPKFDCLLLDIRLEGMSGLDLFRELAAQESHPPVIFVTAHDHPKTRDDAEALGCAGFFCKTSPGAEIVEAIRRVSSPDGQERKDLTG
jgi:FixJ family two-component response regulator